MEIDAYLIFKMAGLAVFILAGSFFAFKKGFNLTKSLIITACAASLGFIVSRFWFIIQHAFGSDPYSPANFAEAWDDAGSVLYGWIIGGSIAIILLTKAYKMPTIKFFDHIFPWVLMGQILNRLGCFAGECCWGKPSNVFWAVYNHYERARLHPVQLYEVGWDFLLLLLLWLQRNKQEGRVSFLYIIGYPLGRFFLEFFRGDNQPAVLGLTVPQIASVIIIICVIISMSKRLTQKA